MSNFVPTNYDLRTSLIFCYHLKKNAAQAHQMLVDAYGGYALSRPQCFRWFEKFRSGDFNVENDERGRPSKKFEDAELQALLDEDDGETVDGARYQRQLAELNRTIRQKHSRYAERHHKVIFLDDNAPPHRTRATKELVESYNWEPLTHAAYSPDLAPSDYHLFASMGHALSEQRFDSHENAKKWLDDWLAAKNQQFFWRGIHKLPERWEK